MLGVLVEPLESPLIVKTLRRFIDFLSSSQGPRAGLKIIVTEGGISIVTSSSSRIIRNLNLEDPICIYVSQIVKAQVDNCNDLGLYTGILTCCVVERVLSYRSELNIHCASRIMKLIILKLRQCLEMDIRIPVEFSSAKQMLCIVRSMLSTKPACGLKNEELESLSVSIVKAFLGTVDNNTGHVIVMTGSGASANFHVYHGILYQVTDEALPCLSGCKISLLLFNVMLTEKQIDIEISTERCVNILSAEIERKNIIDDFLLLLDEATKLNVNIIACQKVVHPSLHVFLRRKGILLLDRLGTSATEALEKLSGAVPISSVGTEVVNALNTMVGHIDSIRLVYHSNKSYLCLQRMNGNIMTLFIDTVSEEATSELQVVVKQCLSSLYQLLSDPVILPGAGCLEMWIAALLQQALDDNGLYNCSRGQLIVALRVVQRAVLSAAGLTLSVSSPVAVDSVYRHAWLNKTVCCCQLVSASDVDSFSGKWYDLVCANEDKLLPEFKWFHPELIFPKVIFDHANVSLYCSKVSALNIAFESVINLLNIGIVIKK